MGAQGLPSADNADVSVSTLDLASGSRTNRCYNPCNPCNIRFHFFLESGKKGTGRGKRSKVHTTGTRVTTETQPRLDWGRRDLMGLVGVWHEGEGPGLQALMLPT